MRNAECQAAAVVADHFTPAAASGPAHLVDSGQPVLQDFIPLPADSDQAPASAPLARGLQAFHLLRHHTGHFHRGPLYPTDMCS
jgi:hypothetical protein